MTRPLLLDLFCGAGGCAAGYVRAGFEVVGVDNRPMPRYPFAFVQDDALAALQWLIDGMALIDHRGVGYTLDDFAAIHASPPCQAYSVCKNMGNATRGHPDLVAKTRSALILASIPFVIENVLGAPLESPVMVCGLALGLGVKRHRLFESSVFLFGTTCPPGHRGHFVQASGHAVGESRRGWVSVCGGGAPAVADGRRRADVETARKAMGIDWMTRDELSQAIPPAYTEFIGRQLLNALESNR